ncbi:MAG: membrane protein insertion efficiency factor YidD [Verrucomicrobia bacterium]|nr:MAG: membrane protein insertion efficiency factor YidD [Verrucomicrobiota bacterium]
MVARNLFLWMTRSLVILLFSWLVMSLARAATPADLPAELFTEGRWQDCLRECRRAVVEAPAEIAPQVLAAVAQLRLGQRDSKTLKNLATLANNTNALSADLRALAAFELGRVRWRQGDATNAFIWARSAFRQAEQPELFTRSGYLLSEILRRFPSLGKDDGALFQTLETCRPLWTPEVQRDVLGPSPPSDSLTVRWIVTLYRNGVRPALGNRCSLTPSCSEYFLRAGQQHGLLAFPIVADRLVREPGVVQAAECPVHVGEQLRYADPLEQHDFWIKK